MALDSYLVVSHKGIDRSRSSRGVQVATPPPFPFRVHPMEDDSGETYYYAQADDIPECSVVGYSPEEVFELMAEAQAVWLDMMAETEA